VRGREIHQVPAVDKLDIGQIRTENGFFQCVITPFVLLNQDKQAGKPLLVIPGMQQIQNLVPGCVPVFFNNSANVRDSYSKKSIPFSVLSCPCFEKA
jgi:hypothetical protein